MKLYDLLEDKAATVLDNIEISSVTDNTKKVQKGSIFVCIKGNSFDGHSAAADMLEKGAAAVVCEHDLGLGRRQIITDNSRRLYGDLCAAWFDHPERKLKLIGVTGTNGKTTITNVIKHILMACGIRTGLVGTIQNEIGDEIIHTDNTTPMVYDLMELLDRMYREGCEYAVMEVSSFGLVQERIGPAFFDSAVFTNLTQDHLDYHKDMEDYYRAKRKLFDRCSYALCNIDDSYGRRLFGEISCDKESFSTDTDADLRAADIVISPGGADFTLKHGEKEYKISSGMPGMFNVSNITAAVGVCLHLGLEPEKILSAVSECGPVKGRCEVIPTGKDYTVICDYAHTPDAIENILRSVREFTEGELVCLFGCGGNRDPDKRPKMAAAAAKYADRLIVTSDNPRNEDPDAIISDILVGLRGTSVPYETITDRRQAIYHALETAKKGDIIVLAGKGHEDYQILAGGVHIHFDEREVVADCLREIKLREQ